MRRLSRFCQDSSQVAIDRDRAKSQLLLAAMHWATAFYFDFLHRGSSRLCHRQPNSRLYETVAKKRKFSIKKRFVFHFNLVHHPIDSMMKNFQKSTSWSNGAIFVPLAQILSPSNLPRAQKPSSTGTRPTSRLSTKNTMYSGAHSIS